MSKIIFWIGANFTHYFIAKGIQDSIKSNNYAIIDITNRQKKFFENQKIVDFKKIWFFHDNINKIDQKPDLKFLERFEKEYNINLSKLVFSERLFTEFNEFYKFDTDEILRILESECRFFENVLNEINPDFVFMFTPYMHNEALFFRLCKAKNIKVLELNATRFGNQGVIGFDKKIKNYKNFLPNNTTRKFEELKQYFYEKNIFRQNKKSIEDSKGNLSDLFYSAYDYFLISKNDNLKTHYSYYGRSKFKVFKNYVSDVNRVKKRKKFIDKNFCREIDDGKYILFPLQTNAESSLLLDAPLFTNQIEIINQISKSMPIDYKLLVKEHPGSVTRSWRSIETYEKIINTPRVIPIHPEVGITDVLKKSSLVVTISSTVALDSLFHQIPSMILADTTFSMIPSIYKLIEIGNMAEAIKENLNKKVDARDLEKYIQFSESISFPFNPLGFAQKISDHFHFSGKFVDTDITEKDILDFFSKEKESIHGLTSQYVKNMEII